MSARGRWRLEDAVPGTILEHPGSRRIGRDEHILLAWLMNNASQVHGNLHRAAEGPFGTPLVLGALSVAIVVGLAAPAAPEPAMAGRSLPQGWRHVALIGPVLPGDTLVASSSIVRAEPDADRTGGRVERIVIGRSGRGDVIRIEETLWAPSRSIPRQ